MQVCNVLHTARWKYRTQIIAKDLPSGTSAQLCRAISSQLRHVSAIVKRVKQQYLLHMSSQYGELGPLAAEIVSLVWSTPANFNGLFRYCNDVAQRKPTKLCTMFAVSWAGTLYIHFRGLLPLREFGQVHNSLCVHVWHCWLGHLTRKNRPRNDL